LRESHPKSLALDRGRSGSGCGIFDLYGAPGQHVHCRRLGGLSDRSKMIDGIRPASTTAAITSAG
jgi:hypothetical protein